MPDGEHRTRRRYCAAAIVVICVIVIAAGGWGPNISYFPPFLVLVDSVSMDGGSDGDDWALGMAYDSNQSVLYVTGFISVPGHGNDGIIWKMNSSHESLVQVGNTTFGGSLGDDAGYIIALDDYGHLFATGYVTESGEGHNIWIARFGLNLTLEREVTVDGPSNGTDEGYGLVLDDSGDVYVAGTVTVPDQGYDIYIGKYDSDLNLERNITIDGPASMTDKGRFMVLDGAGNLFVSGSMSQVETGYDMWLGKFDTDLNLLGQRIIAGPTSGEDKGYGICLSDDGYLYATGTVTESGQSYNSWLAKLDKNLNVLNNLTVNGPANGDDSAYSIGLHGNEIVQVGTYTELSGGENIMAALYGADFRFYSRITINGSANGFDTAFGVLYGHYEFVFVSGLITETSEGQNAWVGRFYIPRPL